MTKKRYCNACGTLLLSSTKFCRECGAKQKNITRFNSKRIVTYRVFPIIVLIIIIFLLILLNQRDSNIIEDTSNVPQPSETEYCPPSRHSGSEISVCGNNICEIPYETNSDTFCLDDCGPHRRILGR